MGPGDSSDPPAFVKETGAGALDAGTVTFDGLDAEIGPLAGEIRIGLLKGRKLVCFFWVCSRFVPQHEVIPRCDIDKASKSKKFDDSITIEVFANPGE
jgi:hypothetical protein